MLSRSATYSTTSGECRLSDMDRHTVSGTQTWKESIDDEYLGKKLIIYKIVFIITKGSIYILFFLLLSVYAIVISLDISDFVVLGVKKKHCRFVIIYVLRLG